MIIDLSVLEHSVSSININNAKMFDVTYKNIIDFNYFKTIFYNSNTKLFEPQETQPQVLLTNFLYNNEPLDLLKLVIESYEDDVDISMSLWNPINKMYFIQNLIDLKNINQFSNNVSLTLDNLNSLILREKIKDENFNSCVYNIPLYIYSNTKEAKDIIINFNFNIDGIIFD